MARYKKAIVSLLGLGGAALALILNDYDPTFTTAVIALVAPATAVVAVFAAKNHDTTDLAKAVAQLQAAAVAVVGYFAVIPTSTLEKVTFLAGAAISVIAVYWGRNEENV